MPKKNGRHTKKVLFSNSVFSSSPFSNNNRDGGRILSLRVLNYKKKIVKIRKKKTFFENELKKDGKIKEIEMQQNIS